MWFLGKRETVNAWKKADFDGFRDKEDLPNGTNAGYMQGISWTVAVGWRELKEVLDYC